MIKVKKEDRVYKNNVTLAIFNALYHDNKNRKQAMLTLTIGDEKVSTLIVLRKKVIGEIKKVLKRVEFKGQKIAYFTNIEFTEKGKNSIEKFNPHIHILFYYDQVKPIKIALKTIKDEYNLSNFHFIEYRKRGKYMGYVAKDYVVSKMNKKTEKLVDVYNEELEILKITHAKGLKLTTSSYKLISNYVIKHIYKYLNKNMPNRWKDIENKGKYAFILEEVKNGNILITKAKDKPSKNYKVVKNTAIYINLKDKFDNEEYRYFFSSSSKESIQKVA